LIILSKLTLSSIYKNNKFNKVKELQPYIILKEENFVVENTLLLYANSMNDKQSF
jgi:hypothetical protein